MKKQTNKQRRRELQTIAALPDESIDTTDIPELNEEQMRQAIRGRMYRPVKKPVTIRLDADVIEWLKQQGPGYQTKANRILRMQMLRALAVSRRANQRAKASRPG